MREREGQTSLIICNLTRNFMKVLHWNLISKPNEIGLCNWNWKQVHKMWWLRDVMVIMTRRVINGRSDDWDDLRNQSIMCLKDLFFLTMKFVELYMYVHTYNTYLYTYICPHVKICKYIMPHRVSSLRGLYYYYTCGLHSLLCASN